MPTIYIPTALRPYADNQAQLTVEATTVREAVEKLTEAFPKLRQHLFKEDWQLRSFVNLYLGDEDVRHLQGLDTPLAPDAELTIVPSVAGGAPTLLDEKPAVRSIIDDARLQTVSLSQEEVLRYSRHLIMPEVTMEGQRRLKAARVLLIGAGGLGSPLAYYLAAAGVGTIGLVDFDVVDYSNLQRQIIHFTSDVGRPKLQSAIEKIQAVNPHVQVIPFETRLTSENALEILRDFDVIVDGTDNFPTRYLVNDACVLLGKPNVYGSIFRFEGQASVFWAEQGPCYRCLYPEPPPPGLVPSCAEGGVLGILPGLIGLVQATETIKLILGAGEPLIGRLLLLDALGMRWRELKLRKDPNCPVCGANPTVRELIDYAEFCGVRGEEAPQDLQGIPCITPQELKRRLDAGEPLVLLDVREPYELEISRLPNIKHIPMAQVAERVHELNPADEVVVICRSGGRSGQITRLLLQMGFRRVKNLTGGMNAYAQEVDPSLPVY
jgi:molybdopterin/thiamine biosynthesis adenylyltransferase/rhodanese-related sulfurtransferase/molybdopterin converting factor small subunit